MKHKIDICLAPSLIDLFDLSNKQVVIIDVFRATSAMCVFLNNGGERVIPVANIEDAVKYKNDINPSYEQKYLVAAERDGKVVPGFDIGNSPLSYHNQDFRNVSLAITTTNGTLAINKAKMARNGMLLASFLNISSIVDYISNGNNDVLIVCSGWKGRLCIEDMLLAGLLSEKLLLNRQFYSDSDSVVLAKNMYDLGKSNLFQFLADSAYRTRMDLDEDVKYCLQIDTMDLVPVWSTFESNKEYSQVGSGFFYANNNETFKL